MIKGGMVLSSTIVSSMSKPSQIHNLSYIFVGYAIVSTLIPMSLTESFTDYLLLIGLAGGFVGTFLFFLKPAEIVIGFLLKQKMGSDWNVDAFISPFLAETKGKITGGIYYSATAFVMILNLNLVNPLRVNFEISVVLAIMSLIVLAIAVREGKKLPTRIRIITIFYDSCVKGTLPMGLLRMALIRGDWIEAGKQAGESIPDAKFL